MRHVAPSDLDLPEKNIGINKPMVEDAKECSSERKSINRNDFLILTVATKQLHLPYDSRGRKDTPDISFGSTRNANKLRESTGGSPYKFCLLAARKREDLSRPGRQARYRGTMKGVECTQSAIYFTEVGRFDALRQDAAEREK